MLTVVFPQRFHIFLPRFRLRIPDISSCASTSNNLNRLELIPLRCKKPFTLPFCRTDKIYYPYIPSPIINYPYIPTLTSPPTQCPRNLRFLKTQQTRFTSTLHWRSFKTQQSSIILDVCSKNSAGFKDDFGLH